MKTAVTTMLKMPVQAVTLKNMATINGITENITLKTITILKTTSVVRTAYLGRKYMTPAITFTILSAVNVLRPPFNGPATV